MHSSVVMVIVRSMLVISSPRSKLGGLCRWKGRGRLRGCTAARYVTFRRVSADGQGKQDKKAGVARPSPRRMLSGNAAFFFCFIFLVSSRVRGGSPSNEGPD